LTDTIKPSVANYQLFTQTTLATQAVQKFQLFIKATWTCTKFSVAYPNKNPIIFQQNLLCNIGGIHVICQQQKQFISWS
jgi:hypothetical protein